MSALSRELTSKAYEKHLVARGNYSGAWDSLADLFAEDATYHDVFYGWMHGREEIREFLRKSMKGIEDWSFPVQWHVVDEGRVVVHWLNRLPGKRPDGTFYEFPGMSAISYDEHGKIVQQTDIYDGISAIRVVIEARSGPVGRALRRPANVLGPMFRETIRFFYEVFDRDR